MSGAPEIAFAPTDRIATLEVEDPGPKRSETLEQERRVAEFELLERSGARLVAGGVGPFDAKIDRGDDSRWRFTLTGAGGSGGTGALDGAALREAAADYAAICEAYVSAVRNLAPSQIAQLDVERRDAHLQGAALAKQALASEIEIDDETARRVFSLYAALISSAG